MGFLSKGVDTLPATKTWGFVGLENGSHSKMGGPDDSFRFVTRKISSTIQLTAQLVVITLSSVDAEEDGALEQEVNHHALSSLAQQSEQLWPWLPFYSSGSFIEVKT